MLSKKLVNPPGPETETVIRAAIDIIRNLFLLPYH
jgi:hypothetical protein